MENKINIKLKSFEANLVDAAAKKIIAIAKEEKISFSGPIPLPTKIETITILRSVHVNKKSREQFESRTHKRLIVLNNTSKETMSKLQRIELPANVGIELKLI